MHLLHEIFEWLGLILDLSASLVMVIAFVVAFFAYLQIVFLKISADRIMKLQKVRCDLGVKLVFALEDKQ